MAFDYREINPEGKLMWFGTQKVLNDFCDHYKLEDGFVTCENEYGASALFYPEFLEQVAKRFRGKFFILPSSIHELILVPDYGEDVKGLKEIVSDVNDNSDAVTEEDFLSNSVYHYDAKLHRLTKM